MTMPEVKIVASAANLDGIVVRDQDDKIVDIREFADRKIKRATRVGQRVAVHLVGAAAGELLVFDSPNEYETAIRREFVTS